MVGAPGVKSEEDELVCVCFDINASDIRKAIQDKSLTFEQLLEETGAGKRCTACMLDLEFIYGSIARGRSNSVTAAAGGDGRKKVGADDAPSLKQRAFALVDSVAPSVPFPLRDCGPVVLADGWKQYLVVVNDSLLYEEKIVTGDFRVEFTLRDREGQQVYKSTRTVPVGEQIREELTRHFTRDPGCDVDIGTIEIRRLAAEPCTRGTTRPQILLEGPSGTCAVHTQGSKRGVAQTIFSSIVDQEHERGFISCVNQDDRAMSLSVTVVVDEAPGVASISSKKSVEIAANGAAMMPVADLLPDDPAYQGAVYTMFINTDGARKVHFLCADSALDSFSIDHI